MLIEYWLRCQCPDCKAWNWLYNGHSQKDYGADHYALRCWNCSKSNWFSDESRSIAKENFDAETPEDAASFGQEKT